MTTRISAKTRDPSLTTIIVKTTIGAYIGGPLSFGKVIEHRQPEVIKTPIAKIYVLVNRTVLSWLKIERNFSCLLLLRHAVFLLAGFLLSA